MVFERRANGSFVAVGICATILLHAGVLGAVYITRTPKDDHKADAIGTFVDAQLVKFGKPRDMSFLPHKQGSVKRTGPAEGIKVARDDKALPHLKPDDKPPDEIDPLKRTHAELFKNLNDDRPPGVEEAGVGSPTGSKAGTATEAKGDPYILAIIDLVGSRWMIPTTIKPSELNNLSADVCLRIAPDGTILKYDIERGSGNSQFDSSLEGALGEARKLPPPPDRFRNKRLCPTFIKQP
jgi:hypothetical protein